MIASHQLSAEESGRHTSVVHACCRLLASLRRGCRGGSCLAAWLMLATPAFALDPARMADSYSVQGWSTEQGLPSSKIRCITGTSDGYLWIATAQGMARFDGMHFTVFTRATNPELGGGGFFSVVEAPDGTLWFGGDNGLFSWRTNHFTHITTRDGLADNYVRALFLSRNGAVVVCTRNGFSFIHDGHITTPGGVWKQVSNGARSYLKLADGSILLGNVDRVWRVSGEHIEPFSGAAGLPGDGFSSLAETPDGSVWIGYTRGLRRVYPDGKTEDYGEAQGLMDLQVVALRADRDGNLWIGTTGGGLYRLTNGRIEAAAYSEQFGTTPIRQIYEDREGGLWIATATGLFRLKDNISASIGVAQGLKRTSVSAMLETRDGSWWIGLMSSGIYRYDGIRATPLVLPAKVRLNEVTCLAEEPAGTLWIGTLSGLYCHAGEATTSLNQRDQETAWQKQIKERPETLLPGLAHRRVSSIATDGTGGIWVATEGALYHGREGEFRAYTKADGLPGNTFKSVIRSRTGDIWVTVPPEGVACLHEGRWTDYLCGKAISDVFPRIVYEDTTGTIWVTTDGGGINRYKDGRWRIFTSRDGLDDDFVSAITEDNLGNLWIACLNGIMRIPLKQFEELDAGGRALLQPRIVNQSDGLPSAEVNQIGSPNACRAHDGRLLFATDRGVAIIQPADLKINRLVLPMHIERFVVNGADVNLSGPLVVPPGNNDVQIHYTAISLLAAEKIRFKIRLAPLDRDWVDSGNRRDVRYAKLPPGDYTFRVTACNSDGVWNEVGVALPFTVQPYFYQTAWFIGLVVVTAGGAGFGIYRVRVRQVRRRTAKLEGMVKERTMELAESQSLYHSLVDQMPAGIFRKDAGGRYVFVNSSFCQIKSMSPEQLLGKTPHEIARYGLAQCSPELATQGVNHHELIMQTGKSIAVEEACPDSDGKMHHLHVVKSPVFGLDGSILGTQGMLFDVTERKQAEAALSYERELLRVLMDNSPDQIYFKDAQSHFLKTSQVQAEHFGLTSAAELVGKTDFDFFAEEHARPAFDDEQEIIRTGRPVIGKVEKEVLKSGKEFWALTSKMPLRNKDGQIIGTFGISKDITDIKETEAKLEQVHKQLLETSRQAGMAEIATNVLHNVGNVLNSVNVSASLVADSIKMSKVSSLAKVVALLREHAHDLGTFFTGDPRGRQLPAYLSQLSEHFLDDQQATVKELASLRANIEHIKEIVVMQQSYARVSGLKEIANLSELVEDTLRMNEDALSLCSVEVIREFQAMPPVNVEKHKIMQILVNLVRNAKHACRDSARGDRRLTVRLAHGAGRFKISVIDNGIGIPPENLTRIFSHGFTTRKDGHGFGLHSGALAAKEMGGSLTVHSDGPDQGATFTLDLPDTTNEDTNE